MLAGSQDAKRVMRRTRVYLLEDERSSILM